MTTKNQMNFIRKEVKQFISNEYAPEQKSGEIKANLSLNINPFGVSSRVMDKLSKLDATKVYPYYPENKELIKLIADYVKVKQESILIGDGCDGCLNLIAKTFISQGDRVIIPTPTFHRYEFHTKLMGAECIFVPLVNFELKANVVLEQAKKHDAKVIFLCNPNNPTGMEIDKEEKIKIIEEFEGLVVVDEALADITDINGSNLTQKYSNLIVVRSFSKSFGLASLRIGYLVANRAIVDSIRKVSSPFAVNGIAQELAIEALQDKDHIKNSANYLHKQRTYLFSHLDSLGLQYTPSTTTNFLIDIEKLGSTKQVCKALEKEGVLVTDANFFRVPEQKYIRVALSSREENEYFIEKLKELI